METKSLMETLPNIQYCTNLNSYLHPPQNVCNLMELENICIERLRVYKLLLNAEIRDLKPRTESWSQYITEAIKTCSLKTYNMLLTKQSESSSVDNVETQKARRRDHIGHWMLSLRKFIIYFVTLL